MSMLDTYFRRTVRVSSASTPISSSLCSYCCMLSSKLLELVNLFPKKIKLIPDSKLMYITSKQEKLEKIVEMKVFLNQLIKN